MTSGPRDWRYLVCSLDSLDVGLYVNWGRAWKDVFGRLQVQKDQALVKNEHVWEHPDIGPILVYPTGKKPNYRHHLLVDLFHIYFQVSESASNSPNVYASIRAQRLWKYGVNDCVFDLRGYIEMLGGQVERVQVSRIDLTADIALDVPLSESFIAEHRVCRSRKTAKYAHDDRLETIYFARGKSPIQLRLYDKLVELKSKPEKAWMHQVWKAPDAENIWRVEFQLRRPALKQFGIDSIDNLHHRAAGVWQYLCTDWFSLRLHDDSNTKRRTVHPLWQAVTDCAELFGPLMDVQRKIDKPELASVEWYVNHIAGCFAGFAARLGLTDFTDSLEALFDALVKYWETRPWDERVMAKLLQAGVDLGPENGGPAPEAGERDDEIPF